MTILQKLTFYTKENCLLCEEAYDLVEMLAHEYPIEIEVLDIYKDEALLEQYHLIIPVVKMKDKELAGPDLTIENIANMLGETCA